MTTVRRVVAPNPGPYTGPGTNTWIVGEAPAVIVIDPGPDDPHHLEAIERALLGAAVGAIAVTHAHPDHLPLAPALAQRHHAHVARYPELRDGDVVRAGKVSLTALYTPGHSADHISFWLPDDRVAFTGDLVLGRGSSMITYPEGSMAAYMRSLERLAAMSPSILFPGHWDPVLEAGAKIQEYLDHRRQREAQVVAELESGPAAAADLTRRIYESEVGDDASLLAAAEMTVRAHLKKLVDEGRVREVGEVYELSPT